MPRFRNMENCFKTVPYKEDIIKRQLSNEMLETTDIMRSQKIKESY